MLKLNVLYCEDTNKISGGGERYIAPFCCISCKFYSAAGVGGLPKGQQHRSTNWSIACVY